MSPRTRPLAAEDAEELAAVLTENREFLRPWEPQRPDSWFTVEGQRAQIENVHAMERFSAGVGRVVVDDAGAIVGRINLSNIVRGAFHSCHLGYWVAQGCNGRGLATAAVGEVVDLAFGDLRLHRVEASTLVHNHGSQRVLEKNGFVRVGLAPRYLEIDGRWQDHLMFQTTAEDRRA